MTLKRTRFTAPQSPEPSLLFASGKTTRSASKARKAQGYYLNTLMRIPFDPALFPNSILMPSLKV